MKDTSSFGFDAARRIAVFDARWIKPVPSGIGVVARELALRLPLELRDRNFVFLCGGKAARDSLAAALPAAARGRVATLTLPYGPLSAKNQILLPAVLRELGADVYHSPNFMPPFAAFPRHRPGRIRCFCTIHDLIPLVVPDYAPSSRTSRMRRLYRFLMRQTAVRSDVLFTDSECSRRDVVSELSLDERDAARVRVAALGVDDAFRAAPHAPVRAESDASPRTLLYVGRMDPYKNVPALVEAFALARAALPFPVRLVIAGAEDARYPEARGKARELGVEDCVDFAGAVPFGRLVELYRTADLLVHPSRYEGFGLQIAEAMAAGLPAICTDGGSAPEIAGGAARVVPLSGGTRALADAVASTLSDPAELARLHEAGLERSKAFTWNAAVRAVASAYSF